MPYGSIDDVHAWALRERRAALYFRTHIQPFGDIRRCPVKNWDEYWRLRDEADGMLNAYTI